MKKNREQLAEEVKKLRDEAAYFKMEYKILSERVKGRFHKRDNRIFAEDEYNVTALVKAGNLLTTALQNQSRPSALDFKENIKAISEWLSAAKLGNDKVETNVTRIGLFTGKLPNGWRELKSNEIIRASDKILAYSTLPFVRCDALNSKIVGEHYMKDCVGGHYLIIRKKPSKNL